jgi:Flp pilus assembly protein CpaB
MKQKNVILMVVAVGCGLAAAVLTSQMSGRGARTDTVEVVVAAKDLPVGTFLTKEEMKTAVKRKKVPKDGLPPAYVQEESELLDKRLARGIRMEETFNPKDLTKGGVITLPPGMNMVALQIGAGRAAAGFIGPGSRVDILATLRLDNKLKAFPLMVNMLVLAVDTNTAYADNGVFPSISSVSFAVDRRQALLLELAKTRGCDLSLMLRNPDNKIEEPYSIDSVEALLQGKSDEAKVIDEGSTGAKKSDPFSKLDPDTGTAPNTGTNTRPAPPVDPSSKPAPKADVAVVPTIELVRIPVATGLIAPGTKLTADLLAEKFKEKEYRKGDVELALSMADLRKLVAEDKALVTGLGKGQYVTGEVIGDPEIKPSPRETVEIPKPGPEPTAPPAATPTPQKRPRHEVVLHAPGGSKVFVYEEIRDGEWRLIGERPYNSRHDTDDGPVIPAPSKKAAD